MNTGGLFLSTTVMYTSCDVLSTPSDAVTVTLYVTEHPGLSQPFGYASSNVVVYVELCIQPLYVIVIGSFYLSATSGTILTVSPSITVIFGINFITGAVFNILTVNVNVSLVDNPCDVATTVIGYVPASPSFVFHTPLLLNGT